MNRTNIEHALCAVLIMAVLWLAFFLLGVPSGQWVGAAAGIAFFAGREFTQAQRTIAKAQGARRDAERAALVQRPGHSNVVARRPA